MISVMTVTLFCNVLFAVSCGGDYLKLYHLYPFTDEYRRYFSISHHLVTIWDIMNNIRPMMGQSLLSLLFVQLDHLFAMVVICVFSLTCTFWCSYKLARSSFCALFRIMLLIPLWTGETMIMLFEFEDRKSVV